MIEIGNQQEANSTVITVVYKHDQWLLKFMGKRMRNRIIP